jgi:hypothetical protein
VYTFNQRYVAIVVSASILIATLTLDSLLSDISSIVNQKVSEGHRIVLFSIIVAVTTIFGCRVVTHYTSRIRSELGSKNNILLLKTRIMPLIQYVIMALLVILAAQVIFLSEYSILPLIISIALSCLQVFL